MRTFTAVTLLAAACCAAATKVSYDPVYGNKDTNGPDGLITKYGWQTIGNIPTAYVGGSSDISGWNSDQCGQCYQVTYNGKQIHVLGIDKTSDGLNINPAGLDDLTNGNAVAFGTVDAVVTKVDVSNCGLTPKKREVLFTA